MRFCGIYISGQVTLVRIWVNYILFCLTAAMLSLLVNLDCFHVLAQCGRPTSAMSFLVLFPRVLSKFQRQQLNKVRLQPHQEPSLQPHVSFTFSPFLLSLHVSVFFSCTPCRVWTKSKCEGSIQIRSSSTSIPVRFFASS